MHSFLRAFLTVVTLCASIAAAALADAATGKPLVINEFGTYSDKGVWLYRTAKGLYDFGTGVDGTNELLVMPSPAPEPGGAVAGVEIIRHPLDTLGYPLHIALVEKLFAASQQTTIDASNLGHIWQYD